MYFHLLTFKFVNWFFEQKRYDTKLAKLAKRCVEDDNFPIQAKLFQEILDYFESNDFKKSDIKLLNDAWNEYRNLTKVEVLSITQLRSKYFESYF